MNNIVSNLRISTQKKNPIKLETVLHQNGFDHVNIRRMKTQYIKLPISEVNSELDSSVATEIKEKDDDTQIALILLTKKTR